MINLINRLLAKFNLKLEYINQKPDTSLVEASVRFMDTIPRSILPNSGLRSSYVGDINYIQKHVNGEFPQVSGETYYKSASEKYFCDYNGDENASFEKMHEATTFTEQKLQNKLNGEWDKDL